MATGNDFDGVLNEETFDTTMRAILLSFNVVRGLGQLDRASELLAAYTALYAYGEQKGWTDEKYAYQCGEPACLPGGPESLSIDEMTAHWKAHREP